MPATRPGLRIHASGKGRRAFAPAPTNRLTALPPIRDNPGNLRRGCYVPEGLDGPAPLVVVLHGCTQNAAVYDHGSGWSALADKHGFILLFPEQNRANNPLLCFNWFSGGDSQRGMGEAASIANMIEAMKKAHEVDPKRVFVTGLSAGGAMASVMLATYPELFAGGAIIAGVAYGCASDVAGAFDCMGGRARSDAQELGAKVRRASPHKGPWPRVQIWQGSADHTVAAEQRRRDRAAMGPPARARAEAGPRGPRSPAIRAGPGSARTATALIEQYEITGMAHGIPLDPGTGEGELGDGGRAHARRRAELDRPDRRLLRHRA